MAGESFIEVALIVGLAGGFTTLGLVWLADDLRWRRLCARIERDIAAAEAIRAHGDVVELHPEARPVRKLGGGGSGKIADWPITHTQTVPSHLERGGTSR